MADHDLFVRHEMNATEHAIDVLRLILPEEEQARLKLDQLEPMPTEYVNDSLRKIITDLTYRVPLRDYLAAICLLMEHKSKGSLYGGDILPFQLRLQEMMVMQALRRQDPNNLYPIVKMVALYHGSGSYTGPKTVGEKMEGPPELIPQRWKTEDIIFVDLHKYNDEFLASKGRPGLFLLAMKHIYDKDLMGFVKRVVPLLQKMDVAEHRDFLIALFSYLMTALPKKDYPELSNIAVKSFSDQTGGAFMTIAEFLTQEVRRELTEQARKNLEEARKEKEQALLREKESIAQELLKDGVDLATIHRCTKLPMADLQQILGRKAS